MRKFFVFKQFLRSWTNTEFIKQVSTKPMNGYLSRLFILTKFEIKPKDDQNNYVFGNLEAYF